MRFLGLFFILIFANFKAQHTIYPMLSVGYTYQNQNFGEVGGKILFLKKDEIAYRIGGSALIGSTHGKFSIMPKIQGDILFNFRENVDIHQGFYYITGAETTTKYFAPYIGISALGILDFTAGYGFNYPNQTLNDKTLKGIKFGISLNIPLVVFQK